MEMDTVEMCCIGIHCGSNWQDLIVDINWNNKQTIGYANMILTLQTRIVVSVQEL